MAISGIGVQVITARSGIGPQLPQPEPRNDNDNDSNASNDAASEQPKPSATPSTGHLVDMSV